VTNPKALGAAVTLIAMTGATSLWADVTAQQVWRSWVGQLEAFGYLVTAGSAQMREGVYVIDEITLSQVHPDGSIEMQLPQARLQELGDGRVLAVFSPEIPMTIVSNADTSGPVELLAVLRHQGAQAIVSGSENEMIYEFTVPVLSLAIENLETSAGTVPFKMLATLKNSTGNYALFINDGLTVASEFGAETLDLILTGADLENDLVFTINAAVDDLSTISEVFLPEGADLNNMAAALRAGFYSDAEMGYGSGSFSMEAQDLFGDNWATMISEGGYAYFSMSSGGILLGSDSGMVSVESSTPNLPFPMGYSAESSSFHVSLPVSKSDETQSAALKIGMMGVRLYEDIWDLFDPTALLSREPAALSVDLSAHGKLLVDLFDTKELSADGPPGVLEAIDINALQVLAAGAELSGIGGFTFDNSFGIPIPKGELDLVLVGFNDLIRKLSAIGLFPSDQVEAAQAMLGLFAVSTGQDRLTTKIELREDGGLYANGLQLQ